MTSSALVVAESSRLDHLADVANGKHRDAYKAAMTMLYAGIEAGEALIEAKSLVKHGEWTQWVRDNCQFGDTAATSYMMVARHKDYLLAQSDVGTLEKAILKLRAEKLTTQTRIDDQRIAEIRAAAKKHGINPAARLLGESYGTVYRYATGAEKTKRVKSPDSGRRRLTVGMEIDDHLIEAMARWLCSKFVSRFPRGVNDEAREMALDALGAVIGP